MPTPMPPPPQSCAPASSARPLAPPTSSWERPRSWWGCTARGRATGGWGTATRGGCSATSSSHPFPRGSGGRSCRCAARGPAVCLCNLLWAQIWGVGCLLAMSVPAADPSAPPPAPAADAAGAGAERAAGDGAGGGGRAGVLPQGCSRCLRLRPGGGGWRARGRRHRVGAGAGGCGRGDDRPRRGLQRGEAGGGGAGRGRERAGQAGRQGPQAARPPRAVLAWEGVACG